MTTAAMAQPSVYTPAHSFVADSANIPNFPGQNLDLEYAALQAILAQYHTNIALLQNDDGTLKNGVVTTATLDTVLSAGLGNLASLATVQALIATATTQAANAATSATTATTQAGTATTQATTATTQATNAATSATNAAASAVTAAAASAATVFKFTWSTNTVSSDPTSGFLKVNNAAPGSATALYISETDANGNALATEIQRWDDPTNASGKSRIKIGKDATNFLLLTITSAVTDNGTWDTFTVSGASLAGTLSNGDTVYVQPVLNGNDSGTLSGMTNHGVAIASAAASIGGSVVLTDGQLVVGQTGADPLAKTLSGDATLAASGALTLANGAGTRTNLGLTIGTNVQAFDADLSTLAALGNWKVAYTDGSSVQTALAVGASGTALISTGAAAAPAFSAVKAVLAGNTAAATLAAGSTTYVYISGSATEPGQQIMMPFAGTARNLYISQSAAGGAGKNYTYTVRKNAVDTALTCVAANATAANDATHSFTFVAGDLLSVKVVVDAAATIAAVSWGVEVNQS